MKAKKQKPVTVQIKPPFKGYEIVNDELDLLGDYVDYLHGLIRLADTAEQDAELLLPREAFLALLKPVHDGLETMYCAINDRAEGSSAIGKAGAA